MAKEVVGFIGLGNMGKPMANNIARAGYEMVVFDIAGTAERASEGATIAASVRDVAEQSTTVFLSLPTLVAHTEVATEIAESNVREGLVVVNTSTVGARVAAEAHQQLSEKGVGYADAPVSGGASGARKGTLTVIFSGDATLFTRLQPLFDIIGANSFNVGSEPGQGQRMKMVNNHLAISALLTTSEALAYGETGGLDMKTMLDILNVSSGRSYTTGHIFPNFVLTETYDSGGPASIIRKDIGLFVQESITDGCRHGLAKTTLDLLEAFDDENPDSDQTEIYPFIRDDQASE